MELQQLRCFVAVADHGSFTRAAQALTLSQPTLSQSVSKLETEFGTELFQRTSAVPRSPLPARSCWSRSARCSNRSTTRRLLSMRFTA